MEQSTERFLEMVRHMRPAGSKQLRRFNAQYLEPVFGKPDLDGNYTLTIGDNPRVMFAAHSDTVHVHGGMQKIQVIAGVAKLHPKSKSNCLGADCTTGIHIILEMIRANIPGMYAIFDSEEIGCIGSRAFVKYAPDKYAGIQCVISFDRKGTESIITHQMGRRTASDKFAADLARILDMPFKADPSGAYTDSNEFARVVSECTNLSVGYYAQHTKAESQDLLFLERLIAQLIKADWSQLGAHRDASIVELDSWMDYLPSKRQPLTIAKTNWAGWSDFPEPEYTMRDLVRDYPNAIADWLEDSGLDVNDVMEQTGLRDTRGYNYGR